MNTAVRRHAVTRTVGLALGAALTLTGAPAEARPNTPGTGEMYRFADGETVENFPSAGGHFRIFFTRAGVDAVPPDDANTNGTPDSVEEVASLYEEVLALYTRLGFRAPISDASQPGDHGGDERFDVYLLDFAGKADGAFRREGCQGSICTGFMVQENDFAGYAYPTRTYGNRVLASHEFFHAVQAAYDADESTIVSEGTAEWASERFDPTLADLEAMAKGYLQRPDHSLHVPLPGPVDAFSYGAGIFFEFLSEKHGDAVIRELWEGAQGDADWFSELPRVLAAHGTSFADAFATFARWNLFTGKRANPALGYARGQGFPLVKIEAQSAPLTISALRVFPAASSYLGLPVSARARLEASLVMPEGADGAPLRLSLAVRRGDVISEPVVADASLRAAVDTAGADELLVVITNTAQSGESLRPGVCVGEASDVEACRTDLGAAAAMAPGTAAPMAGGCTVGAGAPAAGAPLLFLLLPPLALRRRSRFPRP